MWSPHPLFQRHFYWWKERNKIILQEIVMGMKGQKYKYTIKDFKEWKKGISQEYLHKLSKYERTET